jgi:signal recognition particle receptor subunit beta
MEKIVFFGEGGSGKTTIIRCLVPSALHGLSTNQVNAFPYVKNGTYLAIWDYQGNVYGEGVKRAVFVNETFPLSESAEKMLDEFRRANPRTKILFVRSKSDLYPGERIEGYVNFSIRTGSGIEEIEKFIRNG